MEPNSVYLVVDGIRSFWILEDEKEIGMCFYRDAQLIFMKSQSHKIVWL